LSAARLQQSAAKTDPPIPILSRPDLRPARQQDAASVAYGLLPFGLFEQIRQKFLAALKGHNALVVPRRE
jgi:hypothetical protein